MLRRAVLALVVLAACGDDLKPAPDAPGPSGLLAQLNALPGVTATETPTQADGFTYFVLHFTQPVDHDNPGGPTFQQEVSLLHKDTAAPMIVQTSGYWDYYRDSPVELTRLYGANQISIEHRYFAESRPANPDWTKLTIKQMAADEHVIITTLKALYPAAYITTGGSKGGMTAIYHRRFFPDDVQGTVPYVAPISFGAPDTRYNAFMDTLGPPACRQAVRDVALELLKNRRAMVETRAQAQAVDPAELHSYTRITLRPAVESSIASLEWAFWQYNGVNFCNSVPAATDTDDKLWQFLNLISPVTDNDDDQIAAFDAYYYQAEFQLGYPDAAVPYLEPYLMFTDADYDGALPTAKPAYDTGTAMHDVDDWLQHNGTRFVFIYGQWDPWSGGKFELGQATDSLRLIQASGTHGSRITRLADADRDAALAKITAWTGVTPTLPMPMTSRAREHDERVMRVPPALIRARATHRAVSSQP